MDKPIEEEKKQHHKDLIGPTQTTMANMKAVVGLDKIFEHTNDVPTSFDERITKFEPEPYEIVSQTYFESAMLFAQRPRKRLPVFEAIVPSESPASFVYSSMDSNTTNTNLSQISITLTPERRSTPSSTTSSVHESKGELDEDKFLQSPASVVERVILDSPVSVTGKQDTEAQMTKNFSKYKKLSGNETKFQQKLRILQTAAHEQQITTEASRLFGLLMGEETLEKTLDELILNGSSKDCAMYLDTLHLFYPTHGDRIIRAINVRPRSGFTQLQQLVKNNHAEAVGAMVGLLESAIKVHTDGVIETLTATNRSGFNIMHSLLDRGDNVIFSLVTPLLRTLLKTNRQELHGLYLMSNKAGFTPLHQAILTGNVKNLYVFLSSFTELFADQKTVLLKAIEHRNKRGFSCLQQASRSEYILEMYIEFVLHALGEDLARTTLHKQAKSFPIGDQQSRSKYQDERTNLLSNLDSMIVNAIQKKDINTGLEVYKTIRHSGQSYSLFGDKNLDTIKAFTKPCDGKSWRKSKP